MRRRSQRANAAKPKEGLPPDFDFTFTPDMTPVDWTEGEDGVPQIPPDVLAEVDKQFPDVAKEPDDKDTQK